MLRYIIGDPENTVAIPDSISFEQAAPLMCAGVSLDLTKALGG
jgi:D-arabinose 1-dehydrogenase-like Zn-dependent alcohol dehydrogenase